MLILFPTRKPTTGVTPGSTQELRQFLDACVNETKPITYRDRGGYAHTVFLSKVDEVTVKTRQRRDEPALALMMIETVPEMLEGVGGGWLLEDGGRWLLEDSVENDAKLLREGGSESAKAQENFLLECVNATVPMEYQDRHDRKHRVFLTRMTLLKRVEKSRPDEWQYNLTMVDAWGGVWVYALPALEVTVGPAPGETTEIKMRTHTPDTIASANPWGDNDDRPGTIGFAQIGA